MKSKGFMVLESIVGLIIAFLGMISFSLIILAGQKVEQQMELKTDYALSQHIMKHNDLVKVKIHDRTFSRTNLDEE